MREKPITVYWAPAQFVADEESWNFLYQEPKSISDKFFSSLYNGSASLKCPASRFFFKNVFSLNSTITNQFDFPDGLLEDVYYDNGMHYDLPVDSNVKLGKSRENQMEGYVNLEYNHSWFFFSEEDLTMRYSAPYYPAMSPVEGAMLASGSFNIGRWFRPVNLEYYVPVDARGFSVKEDDPLAFIQFETDRPVEFKRFILNNKIAKLTTEIVQSDRYGFLKNLVDRYNLFTKTNMRELLLREIKDNLL